MPNFSPNSIAIIGASATPGKVGHDVLKNLLTQGFSGKIYPINPKYEEILETPCFPSIDDINAAIDLAVIIVPAKGVPSVLEQCGEQNIKTVIIISAGFSETHTDDGNALEEEVKSIAEKYAISVVGPNCLGILNPSIKMNASFAADIPREGNIALFSQSGALAVGILDASNKKNLGFSLVASIGNKAVMNECDFLAYAEKDDNTRVIGLYLEDVADGPFFLRTVERISQKKHVILLKSGASDEGKKAAESHTGALAGSDEAITAVAKQTGLKRAASVEEFLDMLSVLSAQPPLLSEKIAIITNAGGLGVLAIDVTKTNNLQPATLQPSTLTTLETSLPSAASTTNPIDVLGDADATRYRNALDAVGHDPAIDGIVVLVTPQVMTPVEEIAHSINEWNEAYPLIPVVTCFMGGETVDKAVAIVQEGGIPNFPSPERAVRALAALKKEKKHFLDTRYITSGLRSAYAKEVLDQAPSDASSGPQLLDLEHVHKLAELYTLPLPTESEANSKEEAVKRAESIGYPVVLKANAPDMLHKTELGGVKLNLQNADDVESAYTQIAKVTSRVLVQKQLPPGHEFIVGMTRDPSFGPLVMVGLGGIYTELFADTAFRVCPIDEDEAYLMLQELTSWKLLLGLRGDSQADIAGLARVIATVSQLAVECPQISEIDFNPVIVFDDSISIADAKFIRTSS